MLAEVRRRVPPAAPVKALFERLNKAQERSRGQEYASWSAASTAAGGREEDAVEARTKNDRRITIIQVTSSPRHPFGAKTFTARSHCFWQCSSLMKFPTASWTFS